MVSKLQTLTIWREYRFLVGEMADTSSRSLLHQESIYQMPRFFLIVDMLDEHASPALAEHLLSICDTVHSWRVDSRHTGVVIERINVGQKGNMKDIDRGGAVAGSCDVYRSQVRILLVTIGRGLVKLLIVLIAPTLIRNVRLYAVSRGIAQPVCASLPSFESRTSMPVSKIGGLSCRSR
jgi:hypothetical protein